MKEMTDDEKLIYTILVESDKARHSNWELVREFAYRRYGMNLPSFKGKLTPESVTRMGRQIKSMYNECRCEDSDKAKKEYEAMYKEKALDKNKPLRPESIKCEQVGLWWM